MVVIIIYCFYINMLFFIFIQANTDFLLMTFLRFSSESFSSLNLYNNKIEAQLIIITAPPIIPIYYKKDVLLFEIAV